MIRFEKRFYMGNPVTAFWLERDMFNEGVSEINLSKTLSLRLYKDDEREQDYVRLLVKGKPSKFGGIISKIGFGCGRIIVVDENENAVLIFEQRLEKFYTKEKPIEGDKNEI